MEIRIVLTVVAIAGAGLLGYLVPQAGVILAALFGGLTCWLALKPAPTASSDVADTMSENAEPGLAAVAASIAEPLLFVEQQRVTHANAAATALLGDHIVGEDVRIAIRHPAAAARLSGMSDGRTDGRGEAGADAPVQLPGLGGSGRHWEMVIHPLGQAGLLVRLADRSDARAAERMRVDFVANASHELRTPLATLLGFIETLEEANGPRDEATRLRFLKTMMGEARRMQRLIEDLMSLSRIEAERHSVPQAAVRLDELAAEVRDAIATGQAIERDRIRIESAAGPATVAGDRAQLSQLLHNLIGNAIKYGRAGGPVRVTLDCERNSLRLSVEDEGEGIPREHLPRLTERFYRVDPGRSRAIGGTGLGLAIVKHIVERHRGRLEIASVVGKGTTVSVIFPPLARAASQKGNITVTQDAANGWI